MRKLYQLKLCPLSRKVRLVLLEKQLDHTLVNEKYWEKRPGFLEMNPAGTIPFLWEREDLSVAHAQSIAEYLNEQYPTPPLMPDDPVARADARQLCGWFDDVFYRQVTEPLLYEKAFKRYIERTGPDSDRLRAIGAALTTHMYYIDKLAAERRWLAGNQISLADMTAAAHLSSLDYMGSIAWKKYEEAKNWYARMKSRPSFRSLLRDRHPGIQPPLHYDDLDF